MTKPQYSLEQIDAALAVKSFPEFVKLAWPIIEPGTILLPNWHHDLICEYLQAVTDRQIKRLVINMPPRYLKSILVSVLWPAWTWLANPHERFVYLSYAASLSTKHSVDRRRVMQSDWYRNNYGSIFEFTTDQNVKNEFENNRQGRMLATSVGGTLTGKGGNVLVLDDPHNPEEVESDVQRQNTINFIDKTFSTRLDDKKNGAIVCVMQRLSEGDASAHFLEQGYEHLNLQGIAEKTTVISFPISKKIMVREAGDILHPEREGEEELETVKKALGSLGFASQYQQSPAPAEGNLFKWAYWNFHQALPLNIELLIQSWDCAFKDKQTSDFVAGQVWAVKGSKKYLVNGIKQKLGIVKTMEAIRTFKNAYPKSGYILVEDKANGTAVIEMLTDEIEGILAINPEGGKMARAMAVLPTIEAGDVSLPCISDPTEWNNTPVAHRTRQMFEALVLSPFIQDFILSLQMFPNANHDDDVDACTQALVKISSLPRMSFKYTETTIDKGRPREMAMAGVDYKLAC